LGEREVGVGEYPVGRQSVAGDLGEYTVEGFASLRERLELVADVGVEPAEVGEPVARAVALDDALRLEFPRARR
jgi:hypothetical protein